MITYAVGDIHGCYESLRLILDRITSHSDGRPHRIVLLGDYVNIGPDSRKVLDLLIANPDLVALRGHHEAMLLAAARDDAGSVWNFEFHGGAATLRSFGVSQARHIPLEYRDFIRHGLRRYADDSQHVFVHASIDPDILDLAQQDDETLLWARNPLGRRAAGLGRYIVHGHFPQADALPEILPHRCNLDTGGCMTGVFTCGIFDESQPDPIDIMQLR
jgi:serine/threonine protein phosphatase 1